MVSVQVEVVCMDRIFTLNSILMVLLQTQLVGSFVNFGRNCIVQSNAVYE